MKIIKRGIAPAEKTYEAECRTCKTEIEFQRHEATLLAGDRPGETPQVKIPCPICKSQIYVAENSSKEDKAELRAEVQRRKGYAGGSEW